MLITTTASAAKVTFYKPIEEEIDPGADTLCFPGSGFIPSSAKSTSSRGSN